MLPEQQSRQEPLQHVVVVQPVGQRICEELPLFPKERKFRDVPFALLFLLCAGLLAYLASTADLQTLGPGGALGDQYRYVPGVWALGLAAGTVVGVFFVCMLRAAPICMVWTCLLATPVIMGLVGTYLWEKSTPDLDLTTSAILFWVAAGVQLLVVSCYKKYVPMTAEVLKIVSHVLLHHLGMLFIGFIAALLHLAWMACVVFALLALQDSQFQDQHALAVVFFFITVWGLVVFRNVAYLSYCSVFAQWYFGEHVSTLGSFFSASTKGFGAVCFGSLIVAVIQTLRYIAKSGRTSRNGVVRIVAAVVDCMLACIQDMVEWFSDFAYVQVAIRGCGFCDAARATMHLCNSANVGKIIASVLMGSVTFMGCLLSGVVATIASCYYAGSLHIRLPTDVEASPDDLYFWLMAFFGSLVFGFFSAGNVMKIVEAGVYSILVCWAERPGLLEASHPEVYTTFMGTSQRNLIEAPGIQPRLH